MDAKDKEILREYILEAEISDLSKIIDLLKNSPLDEIVQHYLGQEAYFEYTVKDFFQIVDDEELYPSKLLKPESRPHLKLYTEKDARKDQKERFHKQWVEGGIALAGKVRAINYRKKKLIRATALAASITISILLLSSFFLISHKNNNTLEAKTDLIDIKLNLSCDSSHFHKYRDIELLIDNYLLNLNNGDKAAASISIQQAQVLADDLANNLKDRFPQAEINFYNLIKKEDIKNLLSIRNTISEVENSPASDLYTINLKKMDQVLLRSKSLNAQTEISRINTLRARLLAKLNKPDLSIEIADKNIEIADKASYKIIKLNSLNWKKEAIFFKTSSNNSIELFNQTLDLACELGNEKVRTATLMSLTGIYNQLNRDTEAVKYAGIALSAKELDPEYKIQLLNLLAISKFNLGERDLALKINQEAINQSSGKLKTYKIVGLCFSGLMEGQSKNFVSAISYFEQADSEIKSITDQAAQLNFRSIITGYRGKVLALKGDYAAAMVDYRESIACSNQMDLNQDFYMAQLYDGLSVCLKKTGQSELAVKQKEKALELLNRARANSEQANSLLLVSLSDEFTH